MSRVGEAKFEEVLEGSRSRVYARREIADPSSEATDRLAS